MWLKNVCILFIPKAFLSFIIALDYGLFPMLEISRSENICVFSPVSQEAQWLLTNALDNHVFLWAELLDIKIDIFAGLNIRIVGLTFLHTDRKVSYFPYASFDHDLHIPFTQRQITTLISSMVSFKLLHCLWMLYFTAIFCELYSQIESFALNFIFLF